MSDFFKNEIVQGVLAALIGVIILGIFGWLKFKRDEKIVIDFLKNSGVEIPDESSSTTHAIASATKLSQQRVSKVCRKSARIRSSKKQKGCWKLSC